VRRAPNTTSWGFGKAAVEHMRTPTLMVAGIHDKQVLPERVRDYFADLGAEDKVLLDLGCSSHNAMWEQNHLLLFRASLEWLAAGTVDGKKQGVIRLGY
jgi:esterase/lipase